MFSSNGAGIGINAQAGPDLLEISTDAVGFTSVAGEKRLRLLPAPWPANALPQPTSSLFSLAPRSGYVAAAGPDVLVIATTKSIRDTLINDSASQDNIKPFTPQLTISVPRVSQVAFSSDENFLIICAQDGGGLAVYEASELKQGRTQSSFQMATNGIAVRALIPNPAAETGHIVAVLLAGGQLMIANLKERQFLNGSNGPILKEGISCLSWSVKGKQLVVGLGNGTAVQMTPDGNLKAELPRYPGLDGDQHVSGISWLANDTFLIIYTPTNFELDHIPDSTFVCVKREPKTTNFMFQRLPDPCPPFGMKRTPPHHFIMRLREFPPHLTDTLILSSTASGDIGLFLMSSVPLSSDADPSLITNTYATTLIATDSRRAQLPIRDTAAGGDAMVSDDMSTDTSPIGVGIDLSSMDRVKRPIPAEEMDASSTPLPNYMVLNNEGVLSAWWFVYAESVRQGTAYPGLVAATQPQTNNLAPLSQAAPQQPSGFAAFSQAPPASFGSTSTPTPAFGSATRGTTFGNSSALGGAAASAFGNSSLVGSNKSPWASAPGSSGSSNPGPAFGQPGLSPVPAQGPTSGFGAVGGLGSRSSPWASATSQQTGQNANAGFGFGTGSKESPFAALGGANANPKSGFGGFANSSQTASPFGAMAQSASPFAAVGQDKQKSIFGDPSVTNAPAITSLPSFGSTITFPSTAGDSFGAPSTLGSKWGTPALSSNNSNEPFGAPAPSTTQPQDNDANMDTDTDQAAKSKENQKPSGLFGLSSGGFKLKSNFVGDGSAKDDKPKPNFPQFTGDIGASFGNIGLGSQTPKLPTKDAEVAETEPQSTLPSSTVKSSAPQIFGEHKSGTSAVVAEPAPLPPSPVIKASTSEPEPAPLPPTPEISEKSKSDSQATPNSIETKPNEEPHPEPAPLPPSFTSSKEAVESAPVPPAPFPPSLNVSTGAVEPEPAPLPPSPETQVKEPQDHDQSPAGSSPVELRLSGSSLASIKSEPESPNVTTLPASTWKFPEVKPSTLAPSKEAAGPSLAESHTPPTVPRTSLPFGRPVFTNPSTIQPPQMFPRPSTAQESPRSPSPVRNQQNFTLGSPETSKTPGILSTTPIGAPPAKSTVNNLSTSKPFYTGTHGSRMTESRSIAKAEPTVESEDEELFEDNEPDESEQIQAELNEPIAGTKRLASFLAHSDYQGKVNGNGLPAQIEKVYRDINSMIDILGLNARSLRAFVEGHSQEYSGDREGHEKEWLQKPEDWAIGEIDALIVIQSGLQERLESSRLVDVPSILRDLRNIHKHTASLRQQKSTVHNLLTQHTNPDKSTRNKPLSPEQSDILQTLRKDFASTQTALAKAEDAASLLRTKLAVAQQDSSTASTGAKITPTVEAIVNTISKMTRMVEEKSGDVDVLEAQLRRLRPNTASKHTDPRDLDRAFDALSIKGASPHSSPYATPPSRNSRAARRRKPGVFSVPFSPETSPDASPSRKSTNSAPRSMRSSTHSQRATPVGGLEQRHEDECPDKLSVLKARMQKKERIMAALKEGILARGIKIRTVKD